MELVPDTRAFASYSPTSTPILDVLRPTPQPALRKLTTGEYFFASSLTIVSVICLSAIRGVLGNENFSPTGLVIFVGVLTFGALAVASMVHWLGHLAGAWFGKFRVVQLNIGSDGEDSCDANSRLHACGTIHLGGMTLSPGHAGDLRKRLLTLVLSGPAANLLFACLMMACPYWSEKGMVTVFVADVVAICSMFYGVGALMPDVDRKGNYSDGARFVMLVKNSELAARWLAILHLQMELSQGKHPRDWDKTALVSATIGNDDSRDAVTGNWLAYLWAFESQDITSATRYLEDVLAAPLLSSKWLRDRLYVEAAVFQAWFRDNATKARSWAAMIQNAKLPASEQQRLKMVLLWADGKPFDAWEQMPEYLKVLGAIPDSNTRELAIKSALEWKHQMESRMLTRAWRTMYAMSQDVNSSIATTPVSSS